MQYIWNILAYIVGNVLPPALMMILARILNPSDFGYFAVYLGFLSLIQGLFFSPLGEIVIKSDSEHIMDYLFTIQTILILIIGGLLWLVALFGLMNVENQALILPFCLTLFLISFVDNSIKYAMREAEYRLVFIRRLISPIGNAVVSIPLALCGWGYWSLVMGQISANALTTVFIIYFASYPKLRSKITGLRNEYSFGIQMLVQGLMKWLRSKADRVALGLTRTASETGSYDLTRLIASLPFTSIVEPISQVLYSNTARKSSMSEIAGDYNIMQRRILTMSLPLFIFLMCNDNALILFLLGEKYISMDYFFRVFLVIGLCSTFVGSNVEYFKSISRPEVMTRFMIIRGISTAVVLIIFAPLGILYLAQSLLILALLFSPINVYMTQKNMGNNLTEYFKKVLQVPLILGGTYGVLLSCILLLNLNDILQLILSLLCLFIGYVMAVMIFEKEIFTLLMNKYLKRN